MSDNQKKLNEQLFNVIKNDKDSEAKLKKVKYLIRLGADVFYVKGGVSLLTIAREHKEVEIENILIEKMQEEFNEIVKSPKIDKGLKVLGQIKNNKPVLSQMEEIMLGKELLQMLKQEEPEKEALDLVRAGADGNYKDDEDYTVLMWAVYRGYAEVVKELVDNGADVNAKDKENNSALMVAAINGELEVVKYLVENGADIEAKNDEETTILMGAAIDGNVNVVKYLVDNGADIEAIEQDGWTALTCAASEGNLEVVKYLVEKGAKIEVGDAEGDTALMVAVGNGELEVVKYLVSVGANLEVENNDGWNLLFNASEKSMADFLFDCGVDVKHVAKEGETALMKAVRDGYSEVVEVMLEHGADIGHQDNKGWNALMVAANNGRRDMIKILLNKGADVMAKNDEGDTALDIAEKERYVYCVDILKQYRKQRKADNEGFLSKIFGGR